MIIKHQCTICKSIYLLLTPSPNVNACCALAKCAEVISQLCLEPDALNRREEPYEEASDRPGENTVSDCPGFKTILDGYGVNTISVEPKVDIMRVELIVMF